MVSSISQASLQAHPSTIPSNFSVYNNDFLHILGPAPKLKLLLENNVFPFAHEASVYIPSSDALFMSSNIFIDPVTNESTIKVTKVNVSAHPVTAEIINTTIPMPNGGVNNGNGILWAGQGTLNETGGLFQMSATAPYTSELVIGNYYGREFNSINDVVVARDGAFWFTDPVYAWKQGIRPRPQLPAQVYRYDRATKDLRVVADGFGRPNGISFSPDQTTMYISDTAETVGDGTTDLLLPATIYAFDVTTIHGQPFLTNRRVFAMPGDGIPDGIKVDQDGNVKNGTSNFSFGRNGLMFILNENKLFAAQLNRTVRGTLR